MGRVRYGFKNLYYAAVTSESSAGTLTYATPVQIPGAKSMNMSPVGDQVNEYADDTRWFTVYGNNGYEGTIEFEDTKAADTFMTAVLGQYSDAKSVIWEKASDTPVQFAILGQFTLAGGDEVGKRVCFARCIASRPTVEGATKEESITVQTNTINVVALPRIDDDVIKASCDSSASGYTTWFTAVPAVTTTS